MDMMLPLEVMTGVAPAGAAMPGHDQEKAIADKTLSPLGRGLGQA